MPINLLSAGGGTTTLTTANSASNFTVTIPSGTGNALLDSTTGVCRAWVNFNGNSSAIRASYNVSSITRSGTGQYTINLANAMVDANGSFAGSVSENGAISDKNRSFVGNVLTASTAVMHVYASTNEADEDVAYCSAVIFR
jgi:hypothetical protein